uniref:Uncharacterized protein n=1 Tax=Podoviridae sp. ctZkC8 TaxID=2825259 RepID=A0A8S5UC39_9CAUD|nr:MAG TPA: hypothetical protein [Podoviridae sp. ctZkC8]
MKYLHFMVQMEKRLILLKISVNYVKSVVCIHILK